MSGTGTEASHFVEGTPVQLTRNLGGRAVKGAKGVITLIHPKPRFSEDAWLSSQPRGGGETVVDIRLQTGELVENAPFDAIKVDRRC